MATLRDYCHTLRRHADALVKSSGTSKVMARTVITSATSFTMNRLIPKKVPLTVASLLRHSLNINLSKTSAAITDLIWLFLLQTKV